MNNFLSPVQNIAKHFKQAEDEEGYEIIQVVPPVVCTLQWNKLTNNLLAGYVSKQDDNSSCE